MALLQVEELSVDFASGKQMLRAVDKLSFHVDEGEVLGIVGESGSGKSVASLAVMGLIDSPGEVSAEHVRFAEHDLLALSAKQRRRIIGKDIAMIFQDPMTSLNPCFTVGFQIMEALRIHEGGTRKQRRTRCIELLDAVGIPDAASRLSAFPHQLSGGMSQRVMIAMAIACKPRLLIADEPTTALDVTIQAQIMDLLQELNREHGMALILITHDLAVVSESADRIMVMYCGQAVEQGDTRALLDQPTHPYTSALLQSNPESAERQRGKHLPTLPGVVPSLRALPSGCRLHPRCPRAHDICREREGQAQTVNGVVSHCHFPLQSGEVLPI